MELPAKVESTDRNFEVRVARTFLTPDDFAALTVEGGYLFGGEIAHVELTAEMAKPSFVAMA